jgi:hypothetical protein
MNQQKKIEVGEPTNKYNTFQEISYRLHLSWHTRMKEREKVIQKIHLGK